MNLLERLRRRSDADVIVECRRCGTTLDPGAEACPACGRHEFARYELTG